MLNIGIPPLSQMPAGHTQFSLIASLGEELFKRAPEILPLRFPKSAMPPVEISRDDRRHRGDSAHVIEHCDSWVKRKRTPEPR